jgi:hypothetical protein
VHNDRRESVDCVRLGGAHSGSTRYRLGRDGLHVGVQCTSAGAGAAALAMNLLLVYAFLAPTRSTVAGIVREKELRLREGMRILGLKVIFLKKRRKKVECTI